MALTESNPDILTGEGIQLMLQLMDDWKCRTDEPIVPEYLVKYYFFFIIFTVASLPYGIKFLCPFSSLQDWGWRPHFSKLIPKKGVCVGRYVACLQYF